MSEPSTASWPGWAPGPVFGAWLGAEDGVLVAEFKRRRDAALAALRSGSVDVIEPAGAFYLYIRIGDATAADPDPGTTFAARLLEEHDVAVVPGAAFQSPEWIRVSYAAPMADVMEGVRRIVAARISHRSPPSVVATPR